MAIQSNLSFCLNIYRRTADGRTEICNDSPIKFYDDIDDLNDNGYVPEISIRENTDVYVNVQAQQPFKMEIEGMDIIPNTPFQHGHQFYLNEANKEIQIFSHKDFPLSPGEYVITVISAGKMFYTGFTVGTMRLKKNVWEQMAAETYAEIKIMAQQLVRQKLGVYSSNDFDEYNISIYYRIIALEESYFKVIAALNDLRNNPHSRIVKRYVFTSTDQHKHQADFRSVILNNRRHCVDKVYVPEKFKDYNLSENRYVKKVVRNIKKLIREFIDEANLTVEDVSEKLNYLRVWQKGTQFHNNLKVLDNLKEITDKAKKINYAITLLEECDWYKSISDAQVDYFPTQSILDPRYEILDRLNKKLNATTIGFMEKSNLAIAWKRSSELYELWGFIQIIKALNSLGFELIEGPWIIHDKEKIHLGGLKSGDIVKMESSNAVVTLAYDYKLPHGANETSVDNPVYILDECSHVKPDCKMDFYKRLGDDHKKIEYAGSLIIDFKYRTYQSIWNDNPNIDSDKKQLYSYGVFARSKYLLDKSEKYSNNAMHPVYEVWALHPNDRFSFDQSHSEYGVYLFPLVPGETTMLKQQLENFMGTYLDTK